MKYKDILLELGELTVQKGLIRKEDYTFQENHTVFSPERISTPYQNFLRSMASKALLVDVAYERLDELYSNLERITTSLNIAHKYTDALNFGASHLINSVNDGQSTLLEMFVTSTVSSFEAYIQDITFDIHITQPETLHSGKTLTYEEALKYSDMNDLIAHLARKQAAKSTEGTPEEYLKRLGKKFGIEISKLDFLIEKVEECIAIRNLFVHNNGIIDATYLHRHSDGIWGEGDKVELDLSNIAGISEIIRLTVNMIELMVIQKFPRVAVVNWSETVEGWQEEILYFEELPLRFEKSEQSNDS